MVILVRSVSHRVKYFLQFFYTFLFFLAKFSSGLGSYIAVLIKPYFTSLSPDHGINVTHYYIRFATGASPSNTRVTPAITSLLNARLEGTNV
jgi:hypothetical protein